MLKINGESGHPYFVPDFRGNAKINKAKSFLFEKINNIDKPLA